MNPTVMRNKQRLHRDIDWLETCIDNKRERIAQLQDPAQVRQLIEEMIANQQTQLDALTRQVEKKRKKLNRITDRENNPPTCPICHQPMKLGQCTVTLNETQYDLDVNPRTSRLEVHEECRSLAKNFER